MTRIPNATHARGSAENTRRAVAFVCRAPLRHLALALLLALPSVGAQAADGSGEDLRYVELMPTFVTNFGYEGNGRLYYLKADVSLRVTSSEAEMALRYHLPLLRDALVLIFSRQTEETVVNSIGRDQLREEAMAELRALMKDEEGQSYIEDLLFTNFILQR